MDIASPCIAVWRLDDGRCRGCGRALTLTQIAQWARYSDAERMRRLAREGAR